MMERSPFPSDWYVPANTMYNAAYTLLEKLSGGRLLVDEHAMDRYLTQMGEHLEDIAVSIPAPAEKNSQISVGK